MAYLHGTFKDLKNKDVEVQIRTQIGSTQKIIGNDSNSDVFFAFDPIDISLQLTDMFDVILKKTARITLVSKIYLGNFLFANNFGDVSVKIFRDNNIVFDGYVEPNSYNQSYSHVADTFEINCVDKLSVLQYKFWTDTQTYSQLREDVNNYSFKQILQKIDLDDFNVFWDSSKNIGGNSIWTKCGVSLNVFLGESEKDIMSYDDILTNILRYFNLHIIQEGSDLFVFDWNSIKNNSITWTALFGSESTDITAANISVTKEMYSDDNTNLSMSDVYNQIEIRCIIDAIDNLVPSILDTGDLEPIFSGRQLAVTECWYDGGPKYKESASFFQNSQMFSNPDSNSVSADDATAWHVKDWYVKWLRNPKWNLYYKNNTIDSYVSNSGGTPINQHSIMKLLFDNKFMPALISIGSGQEIKNGVQRRSGTPELKNYLVISGPAGWGYTENGTRHYDGRYNSLSELLAAIDTERIAASGSTGLVSYSSGTALNASPIDDESTNFIIITGNMILEPVHWKASWGSGGSKPAASPGDHISWGTLQSWLANSDHKYFGGHNHYSYNEGVLGHYEQVPWTARNVSDTPTADTTDGDVFLSPPVGTRGIGTNWIRERLKYNKSKTTEGWSDEDTINKISVLECELKIGEKYCVEDITNLDEYGCPTFHWYTSAECVANGYPNKSFTVGFDPAIGDFILGRSFPLTNTVDGRRSSKQGMCIPIKKSDALSGVVTFKIKGVLDMQWDVYFQQNRTASQSSISIEGTQHLWPEIASIWIEDFNIVFDSDKGGAETNANSSDIVYQSAQSHDYINKKDDIEFYLNTQLSTSEAASLGLSSAIAYSNVIDLSTNLGITNITASNGTDKAEKLYIDQYWSYYNQPKVVVNTQLNNNNYSVFDTFTFSGFGKTIPQTITYNLKRNVVDIQGRQI